MAPINFVGPIMACIGIGEVLRDSGHRVVFAVRASWRKKLTEMGFSVEVIGDNETDQSTPVMDTAEQGVELIRDCMQNQSALQICFKRFSTMANILAICEADEPYYRDIIDRQRPDAIILDNLINLPSVVNSGCVWIKAVSDSPLMLDMCLEDSRLPPSLLGLSINDKSLWDYYRQQVNAIRYPVFKLFGDWFQSHGCPAPADNQLWFPSPYANFYLTPKELDYTDVRPMPDNFYQFDYYKRTVNEANEDVFELPKQLRQRSGKLIYLSLGSTNSADVDLMKRLVGLLAKSEHRIIVSKGINHDKYELADNMWGEKFVPQIKVLPIVDLFITHGGNNSVTECMYFGKPMIVLPLFWDQFDNAQRVEDKGYGIRLNPYECSEQQLLQSIDSLLNDNQLAEKLKKASKRIQTERQIERIPEMLMKLVKDPTRWLVDY
ncbi:UDP-glucuronosyltransferase 3A1-like [Oppia nitens]|uniref:UDP-glucuronosyltransferase 3A1-like n=1 Tax=Oppia nitens TaxID=1686743 RepID=UPI0023DA4DD3|nr:UDP-glucuronosyltransferase 3A1-like [Oppia nitens]